MDASLLKILGQIAGIGGIAIGAVVLIFRDVVRRKIFPQLKPTDAYRLIRLIVVLTFSIGVVGIGAWVYVNRTISRAPAEAVVQWTRNWATINEGVPRMSSSDEGPATNRERILDQLNALQLPNGSASMQLRDKLVAAMQVAEARPGDRTYNVKVPEGFDNSYSALRRMIRDSAIGAGVTVDDDRRDR